MLHTYAAGRPRRAAVLASILALHVGLVLVILNDRIQLPTAPPAQFDQVPLDAGKSPDVATVADRRTAPVIAMDPRRLAALFEACYPGASRRMGEEGKAVVRLAIGADAHLLRMTPFGQRNPVLGCAMPGPALAVESA